MDAELPAAAALLQEPGHQVLLGELLQGLDLQGPQQVTSRTGTGPVTLATRGVRAAKRAHVVMSQNITVAVLETQPSSQMSPVRLFPSSVCYRRHSDLYPMTGNTRTLVTGTSLLWMLERYQ